MLVEISPEADEAKMDKAIGRNIRQLRRVTGYTQEAFATVAGVTRGAVSQYESGTTTPRMATIRQIAGYFGIPESWLVEEGGMNGVTMDGPSRLVKHVEPPIGGYVLTENEMALVSLFRSCSEEGRNAILNNAKAMADTFPRGKAASGIDKSA